MSAFRRMYLLVSICCIFFAGSPGVHADTVALWLFDDPPGSTVAVDSSGNGYDLTLGPDAAIVEGGKFGRALNPDATEEDGLGAFRYKAEAALNPDDTDWTIECWVKARPDMHDDNRIWGLSGINYIDYGRGSNMVEKRVADRFGRLDTLQVACRYLPLDGVNGWNKPTGDLKADREFHHFAVVYDSVGKEIRHYFDGKLQCKIEGQWHSVFGADNEAMDRAVFPPHYPMLQVGMRDAIQQWDHHELVPEPRQFKKFEGLLDEMRFSDAALYDVDFTPPASLGEPFLRVEPATLSLLVDKTTGRIEAPPLEIAALGAIALNWSIKEQIDWLEISRIEGTAGDAGERLAVEVDARNLQPGNYEGVIEVRGTKNSPIEVNVMLTVTGEGDVRNVGDRKQLFIDRRFIESSDNVELNINQAEKVMLDVDASRNFDGHGMQPLSVMHDPQRNVYRIYYLSGGIYCLESTDGFNWRQLGPEFNNGVPVIEQDGKQYPVIVAPPIQGLTGGRASALPLLIYDAHDVPERRYKLFQEYNFTGMDGDGYEVGSPNKGPRLTGVYGFYSADGIHFKPAPKRLLPFMTEVLFGAYWDESAGRYHIFTRCLNLAGGDKGLNSIQGGQFIYRHGFTYQNPEGLVDPLVPENMIVPGFENIRSVTRLDAADLMQPWTIDGKPVPETTTSYATPEHLPMVSHFDKWDGFQDLYFGYVTHYPYAENMQLMLIMTLRHFHPSRQPWRPGFADVNGPLEMQLAVSRDGSQWDRLDRESYVDLGLMNEFDRARHQSSVGLIRIGNYIYQYIKPGPGLHDPTVPIRDVYAEEKPEWADVLMIGLRQRLDGFVSADADYKGGSLTTPPIVFSGKRLVINENCSGQGTMFVEIRDINDQPIPGLTLGDCEEITYNDVAWEVRWQGKADVSALAGKPVKLHFRMTNAKLYAFQFEGD
jgi:hypothetical protein